MGEHPGRYNSIPRKQSLITDNKSSSYQGARRYNRRDLTRVLEPLVTSPHSTLHKHCTKSRPIDVSIKLAALGGEIELVFERECAGLIIKQIPELQALNMATAVGGIDVIFRESNRDFSGRWRQLSPGKEILTKGWKKAADRRALEENLIFESDVCITLRDGARIWADVFRPELSDSQPVPAILAWSPYGKQGNGT